VRRERSSSLASHAAPFTRRLLFPLERFQGTEFYEIRIAPRHREQAEAQASGTRENLVVARGVLTITIGEEPAVALVEGDAVLIDADVPRSYENSGDGEALVYLVIMHCARSPV
jgi:quercetin dioxygenase-like cupin family protein